MCQRFIATCKYFKRFTPENYNSEAEGSTASTQRQQCVCVSVVSAVTSLQACVCAGLGCLCVDAQAVMSAHRAAAVVSGDEVEAWDHVELQQLEPTPKGELGKWPQTSPQRTQQDTDRGRP